MQSVACNAMHPVEARCCRWILMMRDRTDTDEIPLTQEFLSEILSVHRSSVSLTIGTLQEAGYLQAKRGSIRILDRAGLENVSCECYQIVRDRFEALLRSVGLPVSLADKGLDGKDATRLATIALAPENRPMIDNNAIRPDDAELLDLARAILEAE